MAKYVLTKEEVNESSIFEHVAVAAIQPQPSQYASNIHFLITLRADFLGYALSYRPFADALQHNDLKLGPMTRQELQVAIQKPAQKLRIQIEAGLTERILNEISQQPGNLPLIEFTLTLLWEKQQEGRLTHAAYDEIGGVEQALASYADNIYEDLSQEEKQHAKRVFVQLVSPGEGTEDTRRLATRVQIGEEGWNLVVKLSNARLVVCSRDEILGEETVESCS